MTTNFTSRPTGNMENPFQASRVGILNIVLIGAAVLTAFVTITFYFVTTLAIFFFMVAVTSGTAVMAYRTDWPYQWRVNFLLSVIYILGIQDLLFTGLVGDGRLSFILLVLLAILFLGRSAGYVTFGITVVSVWLTSYFASSLPKNEVTQALYISGQGWRLASLYMGLVGLVVTTALRKLFSDTNRAIQDEEQLIAELTLERQQTEERIASRARALHTSTEISRSISSLLAPDELISVVLEQIRAGFGYYHVQLYLLEPAEGYLHLVGSTGAKGDVLMNRKHKVAIGRGIVGRTAFTQQAVVAPDVTKSDDWLPNPELPETKAELAVPLRSGDHVQGVLDVQQNRSNSLSQDDIYVLQVIADQLSVALQNAQQYGLIQQRAQREQFLSNVQSQLQAAQTPEEVLATAAKTLAHALNRPHIHIRLGELNH